MEFHIHVSLINHHKQYKIALNKSCKSSQIEMIYLFKNFAINFPENTKVNKTIRNY